MPRWQRHARIVLALVGVATVLIVVFALRDRRQADPPAPVVRTDPRAVVEGTGVQLTQATGIKVPGVVDAERSLVYQDGTTKLIGPRITSERGGRKFLITGREALLTKDHGSVTLTGDVELTSNDGWAAETGEASYSRGEGVVRAPGAVSFAKGAVSGRSVGMTYDQQRDVVWLLDQAEVTIAPGEGTGGGAVIRAGAAGFARREKYMRFEGGVRMEREGRVIEADTATAYLTDDEQRLESLELRGNSRIAGGGGGLGALRARDMNLTYAPDGETLERAVLAGTAAIETATGRAGAGQQIAAEFIDSSFGPDGDLTDITARDRVAVTLAAAADEPPRVIRSTVMRGAGTPGQGLTSARFSEGVEFREGRDGPAQRRARARTLDLRLADGSVEDAHFQGGTRFEDGTIRASALNGRYQVNRGRLELTGAEGPNDPRVQDERITIDAKRIDLTFQGPRMAAAGEVRSVMQPQPGTKTAPAARGAKSPPTQEQQVPGLLEDDKPAYVTGASLDYDGGAGKAIYTGGARLWQGATTIVGQTITIDESTGNLAAAGQVRSTLQLDQRDTKTGQVKTVDTIASAQELVYEDALRRATYTTEAHVNGPQGDVHAVKVELYFVEDGGGLERAEAYEQVRLQADARTATGARMTFFAPEERYVMTGDPVRIVEECRETLGKTLTFWRSTDRILVDGNEERRTLTKSGGACPEPR